MRWRLSAASPANRRAQAVGEHGFVDDRGRPVAEREQVGGDLAFLAPVAIEVERAADEAQGASGVGVGVLADGDEWALRQSANPRRGLRPWQRREVDRLVGVDGRGRADRGEVDEDVAEPRAADGEGGAERDPVVVLAREPGQPHGDVDVGGG